MWIYDPELRDALRARFPHLDVRDPQDEDEQRLAFARVDSIEQISLPYDRRSAGPVPPELVYGAGIVRVSYQGLEDALGRDQAVSHAAGIEPRQSIIYRRLEAGTIVGCYQSGEYTGRLTGSYVTPDIGATLDQLGVPAEWAAAKTHFALFEVVEEHFVLETVAAPFRGTAGGARQYYLTSLDDRDRYRPRIFPPRSG